MNIVYFGTDVFLKLFRYFNKKHNIMALYTYYNAEDYFTEYNIVREAKENGIPVFYSDIKESDIRQYISRGCELFFLAEYNRKIPCISENEGFCGINVHSSLLPAGKGYYPIENAMMCRLPKTGVTMHKVTDKIDRGDIIARTEIEISECDDSVDIYMKCAEAAYNQLIGIMNNFKVMYSRAIRQSGEGGLCKRPDDESLHVHHGLTVSEAENIFRCFNKMSYFTVDRKKYRIVLMKCGHIHIDEDIMWISDGFLHFRLLDGYARIAAEPYKEAENEK